MDNFSVLKFNCYSYLKVKDTWLFDVTTFKHIPIEAEV